MGEHSRIIRSTADLTPAGLAGYRKAFMSVVSLLGTVLAAIQPMVLEDSPWARWIGIGIAVCGAIGVVGVKNDVQPEEVVVPPPPADVVP